VNFVKVNTNGSPDEAHSGEERLVSTNGGSLDPAWQEYGDLAIQVSLAFLVVERRLW
jgi:hypothetical protein